MQSPNLNRVDQCHERLELLSALQVFRGLYHRTDSAFLFLFPASDQKQTYFVGLRLEREKGEFSRDMQSRTKLEVVGMLTVRVGNG